MHKPIISESAYWLAQEILKRCSNKNTRPNSDFPLRGVVRCQCGGHLTASYSKGKKKYYMFYQCVNERGKSHRGDMMHSKIEEVLDLLSFSEVQILKISEYAKQELSLAMDSRTHLLKVKQKEFREIVEKIDKLEFKMINDGIEASTYKVWFSTLNSQKAVIEDEIISLKKPTRIFLIVLMKHYHYSPI